MAGSASSCAFDSDAFNSAIPKRVFVGNFDFDTSESELLVAFQVCGHIADVNIVRKSISDFYGFVTFASEEAAEDALRGKYDFFIRGRKLRIRRAFLKSPKSIFSDQGGSMQIPPMSWVPPVAPYACTLNGILASIGNLAIAAPYGK